MKITLPSVLHALKSNTKRNALRFKTQSIFRLTRWPIFLDVVRVNCGTIIFCKCLRIRTVLQDLDVLRAGGNGAVVCKFDANRSAVRHPRYAPS